MSKHLTPASVRANIPLPVENSKTPANLNVGDQLTLTVDDLAFGGEGVCRLATPGNEETGNAPEYFVIFVPFVIPGETITAEITEIKKQYARAKLLKVLTISPERVKPKCKHFTVCGGCQYQHIEYGAQLRYKHKQISDIFIIINSI